MKTTINEQDGALVALLEGRLDTAAAAQTQRDIEPLLNCGNKDIVLDCSGLEYIASSGLRLFLTLLKNAKSRGATVYITGANDTINETLTVTGFHNLFRFK